MKFIHLTDTHVRKAYDNSGIDAMLGQIESIVPGMERMLEETDWDGVDFVVVTGDLVHEGVAQDYTYLNEILRNKIPQNVQLFYVLGNHDEKDAFYKGMFNEEKTEPYYYIQYVDGYRLIMLDSAVPGKESGFIVEQELDWLKETLKEPYGKGSIVFLHHPLFWAATGGDTMAAKNGKDVMKILKESDAFAVFCGHTHTNAVNMDRGIFQSTADSAAFSLEIRKNNLAFTDKSGFSAVEIKDHSISVHQETMIRDRAVVEMPLDIFAEALKKLDHED